MSWYVVCLKLSWGSLDKVVFSSLCRKNSNPPRYRNLMNNDNSESERHDLVGINHRTDKLGLSIIEIV